MSMSEAECQEYGESIGEWGGVVSLSNEIKGCYYLTGNISPKVWYNTDSTSVADCSLAERSCIQKVAACTCSTNNMCIEKQIVGTQITTFPIHGSARFVKVNIMEGSGAIDMGIDVSEAGQIGVCNTGSGVCECLPPFTSVVEELYVNWRGYKNKRLKRLYELPETYDNDIEFRIRAMQGKEAFTTKYIKKDEAGAEVLAYSTDQYPDWKLLYTNFRDDPGKFNCRNGIPCTTYDFILLGTLASSSNRYNFDCNTQCENIDPITRIPCSGHGSCKVTGVCICDPAAYVSTTDPITGFSITIDIFGGESIENSDYQATKYELTGWRGVGCDKMCPGYDPIKKSMLDVCSGHGVCNGDATCECEQLYW